MIRLVTDSTCDLPDGELASLHVSVVPINIHFDTAEFQEGVTLSYDDFFAKVDATGTVPKTSQPSPGRFVQEYRRLAGEGATTILSLHVTGLLSGTVNSAELAAGEVKNEVGVHVFDSLAGSAGIGFMMREADALLQQGADADTVLARWREIRDHLSIYFYLDTLKYARMSGRVGALQHSLASVLSIKPLVKLDNGMLDVAERVRSRRAALDRLLVLAREHANGQPVNVAVVHAMDQSGANTLMARAQELLDCRQTFVARLASSLVTNLGVGTLGIVLYPVEP